MKLVSFRVKIFCVSIAGRPLDGRCGGVRERGGC